MLGLFVVLRANELVPQALRFTNYKLFMRTSYALYMLATLMGVIVYVIAYVGAPGSCGRATGDGSLLDRRRPRGRTAEAARMQAPAAPLWATGGWKSFATPDRRILLLSVALQLALAAFFGHSYDTRVFMAAGYLVGTGHNPYVAPGPQRGLPPRRASTR